MTMKKLPFNLGLSVLLTLWLVWGAHRIGEALFPEPEPRADVGSMMARTEAPAKKRTEQVAAIDPADLTGDAGTGEGLFRKKCKSCHIIDAGGKHAVGPNLHGVVGRKAGTADGYRYSKAMAGFGKIWEREELLGFLASPRAHVPGTKMTFAGFKKARDLANIVAYLISQSDRASIHGD